MNLSDDTLYVLLPDEKISSIKFRSKCRNKIFHNIISLIKPTGTPIDFLDIWKGMEEVKMMGLARSIGLSNFDSKKINTILAHGRIRPSVNQIEVNFCSLNSGWVYQIVIKKSSQLYSLVISTSD